MEADALCWLRSWRQLLPSPATHLVDQTFVGQITADGVRFKIAGTTTDLLFAQHDIDDVVVPDVLITLSMQSKLCIGEHTRSRRRIRPRGGIR